MSWFGKLVPSRIRIEGGPKRQVPEGIWAKCENCSSILYRAELDRNLNVCPKCSHHMRIDARRRLDNLLDEDGREEVAAELEPIDFLKFKDSKKYKDRLIQAQKTTKEKDALIAMQGHLKGLPVVVVAFQFEFMAGSMGSVVGERFARAAQRALEQRQPLICFSSSGGARMQEALLSLFQMAKTSAAIAKLKQQGIPYISVLTDTTRSLP